jgi:hypothetical protein
MLPPLPVKCRVDEELTDFQYDRPWHMAHVHVTTPALPVQPVTLNTGEAYVEKFDPGVGEWLTSPLHALEDLGPVPYGYVKYRTPFTFNGESKMFISTRADDAKKVFVNGKFAAEASNKEKLTDFPLGKYAQPGNNVVEISYELFGAPNFGENLGELKGLESVGLGGEYASAKGLESWQIQRFATLMRGRELRPEAAPAPAPTEKGGRTAAEAIPQIPGVAWAPASFAACGGSSTPVAAFTWCRAKFSLPQPEQVWNIPWKLTFDADCDALIFLNGKFVGRYVTIGPQKEFYLPEPYFSPGDNTMTFLLAYTDHPGHLRRLQVAPYPEYSVRRTRFEFEW